LKVSFEEERVPVWERTPALNGILALRRIRKGESQAKISRFPQNFTTLCIPKIFVATKM
jgi:hypothetical protein